MRLVICWLMLLPLATAAPIRARRENVVTFLNDALSKPTRKTVPAIDTAHRNPPSETEKEQDSEQDSADLSEDQSFESASQDTIAGDEPAVSDSSLGGESKDLDSDETPRTKEEAEASPGRQMGAMPVSRRRVQDQQSGEDADLNNEEEVTDRVNVQSMVSVQGSSFQRKESAEGAHSLDTSRELAERRSLEMTPAAVVQERDDDGSVMQEVGASPS
ncbi:uncharacterized protein LOC109517599 isoform X1 [Hippocampus comes]|uniref:uncharacterized protein LOC109517599 isoform X1 n=1 Tax=Hippocampus comes TaxID=109280 RepID=UPI00094E1759|nr:PREDICTED: uncharacterized protein LOC109517599 isoform X1 [Hippocampus comes]